MYTVIVVVHIIVSVFLIAVILLQAGRGGGLADSMAGSQMQSMFGTKSTNVLTKLTAVCAIVFIITCISLAIVSSHRSKSLIEKMGFPEATTSVEVNIGEVEEKPMEPLAQTDKSE